MEAKNTKLSKITSVVNKDVSRDIIAELHERGASHVYIKSGRSSILEERKGVSAIFASGPKLDNDPVDILSILVRPEQESRAINLIANMAQLHVPGYGSIYSEDVNLIDAHKDCGDMNLAEFDHDEKDLYTELVGIACIVQRGHGDTIARAVLDSGVSVPTITYGIGTGFRDKLGLLRITIPAEKEILTAVISNYDISQTLELMIGTGRIDQPGKGFIFLFPVKQGLINVKITRASSGQAASMEQIVGVLDTLKGGMGWRQSGHERGVRKDRQFFGGINLNLSCDEGRATDLVAAAMDAGAAGATISTEKLDIADALKDSRISRAREICDMMISEGQLDSVTEAIRQSGAFDDNSHGMILTCQAPKAFTCTAL